MYRGGRGGGGRGGGGSSRGRGRGGSRGGRDGNGRESGSAIYSVRHKRIFDNDDDDDEYHDAADDLALDDIVGDNPADEGRDRAALEFAASVRQQEEAEERALAAKQKKIDRKQNRKQAKADAKQSRISAQQEWSEKCRQRREQRERQRAEEKLKEKRVREKEQQMMRKKQLEAKQQPQKKKQGADDVVRAADAGKKKAVSFDIAVKNNAKNKAEKQKQQPPPAAAAREDSSLPTVNPGAYVPPALRNKQQQQNPAASTSTSSNATERDSLQQQQQQQQKVEQKKPLPTTLANYVVPARRKVSASLSSQVQRCFNKLVLENSAAISTELVNLYSTSSDSRADITAAVGTSVVNSSIGSAHLTSRQALAIAVAVRALQLKCGPDVGATLVSRVAAELRASILLGPDNAAVHTSKFLEDIERRAAHGAVMLGALTHTSVCSAHLTLSFLHECSQTLQEISQFQAATAGTSSSSSPSSSSTSFLNEATCIASCCLQLLRTVGHKLFELVPMQLNGWINHVELQLQKEQKGGSSSSKGAPVWFASIRLEVVLSLAKQLVTGGSAAAGAGAGGSGSRRQRGGANDPLQQNPADSGRSNNAGSAPDEESLTKALDSLVDVVRPGATAQDRRAWKRAHPSMSVPELEWGTTSQPDKQGPRWWEKNSSNSNGGEATGLLWEKENEEKLSGVVRRELKQNNNDGDGAAAREDDDDDAVEDNLEDFDNDDGDDDSEAEDLKRQQKLRGIKRLRAFESAASGQRFVSERQRTILQVLDSAFDDGEACQRLMHHVQQNEATDVAAVIVQCCSQEATYNSFYAKVTSRLLSPAMPKKLLSRAKKAFQYAVWDKFGGMRVAAAAGALPDVSSLLNVACYVVHLLADGRFDLSLLRGLDIDVSIPASVGLFLRILLLRCLLLLDFPTQIASLFFGHHTSKKKGDEPDSADELEEDGFGNVRSVLGANSVIKQKLRAALLKFVDEQFVDEAAAGKWMVPLFDVVAGNSLEPEELEAVMEELPKRIKTMRRAIHDGGE